jgi:chorismate dehydratase
MRRLKISAISFLNTAPLMWDFENGASAAQLKESFDVSYTIPSRCAEELKAGTADIGIIPVAAYTTIPDLVVIPNVAIAAKDAVRSILLISKVPLDKIRSVATDNSSRTSAALTEVFLRKFVGVESGFTPQQPDVQEMLRWHDACLLIGDPALQAATVGRYVYDLAEQWHRWTGYPFVFAFWTVRQAALQEYSGKLGLAEIFQQSRDHGLQHVDEIAADWAPRLGLEKSLVHEYLSHNIDYFLDGESLQGLRLFFRYAAELNVLPTAPEIRFVQQPSLVQQPSAATRL